MPIAVDAMGGDYAPQEVVKGAVLAAQTGEIEVALVGRAEALEPLLPKGGAPGVTIVPAATEVPMDESPGKALRHLRDSSMGVAVQMVASGEASAVVSAGNSGAIMAFAVAQLRRIAGIDRPAIAMPLPTPLGERLLLDAGANVDCQPENLVQFAILGSAYCEKALGVDNPRVGLLSIGSEPGKGNDQVRATFSLLRELHDRKGLNFIGFTEGNHILDGTADVIVCDGFVGNALLKSIEGVATTVMGLLKDTVKESALAKVGLLFLYPSLRRLRHKLDYSSYGGALLLGVRGIAVVCHGRSNAKAIANAIRVADRAARNRVVDAIAGSCEQMCSLAAQHQEV
jgi:glycerol-3-phosphate acyltransferase PlsX